MPPKKKAANKAVVDLSTKMDDRCEEKSESSGKNSPKITETSDEKKTESENTISLAINEKVMPKVESKEPVEDRQAEKQVQQKAKKPVSIENLTGKGVPLIYQERLDQLLQNFSQEQIANYKLRMLKFGLTEEQLIAILQQQLQAKKKPASNQEGKWKKHQNHKPFSQGRDGSKNNHKKTKNGDDRSRSRDRNPTKARQHFKEAPFPRWRARQ